MFLEIFLYYHFFIVSKFIIFLPPVGSMGTGVSGNMFIYHIIIFSKPEITIVTRSKARRDGEEKKGPGERDKDSMQPNVLPHSVGQADLRFEFLRFCTMKKCSGHK